MKGALVQTNRDLVCRRNSIQWPHSPTSPRQNPPPWKLSTTGSFLVFSEAIASGTKMRAHEPNSGSITTSLEAVPLWNVDEAGSRSDTRSTLPSALIINQPGSTSSSPSSLPSKALNVISESDAMTVTGSLPTLPQPHVWLKSSMKTHTHTHTQKHTYVTHLRMQSWTTTARKFRLASTHTQAHHKSSTTYNICLKPLIHTLQAHQTSGRKLGVILN